MSQKNYLILGASGGVGKTLSEKLLATGALVDAVVRNPEELKDLQETYPEQLVIHTWDANEGSQKMTPIVHAAAQRNAGKLLGAVNAIGSIFLKPLHMTSDEDWNQCLTLNLSSSFWMARACVQQMQRTGGGSLVFFSSVAAQLGLPSHEAISAAKAGIEGLVRSLAATYAARGIRVNGVAPSLTQTKMASRFQESTLKISESMHPLKRLGKANDVSSAALWLLNEEQSWITGQILAVDGGFSRLRV